MTQSEKSLPVGFLGPVRAWSSLVPSATRSLVLPREQDRLAGEPGTLDLVEVVAFTESMGRIESALATITGRLVDGGVLLLDVENVQSARMLRLCVEGRPGAFDPAGSSDDPSQFLSLKRVLAAAQAAGLWVQDVIAVPTGAEEFSSRLASSLFSSGLLPLEWLGGTPPARWWLVAQKVRTLAGSVLIAGGDDDARRRTETALRRFLPSDWEIVTGTGTRESAQWNRALASSRGEVVWFLRGGCEPGAHAFAALAAQACIGPVAPGKDGVRAQAGDIAGLMLPRLDAMLVGALPEWVTNTPVALEEYTMRLDSKLPPAVLVDVGFSTPVPVAEAPAAFAAEASELVQRWSPVQGSFRDGSAAAPSESTVDRTGDDVGDAHPAAPWAGRAPRVSLCMIARDEERFLPECLARVRDAVDEIVLVDTGSNDRTVAIAESFGAKVLHSRWDDDFSAPRNLGLAAATGDWILVLDADEFVQDGGCRRIRELVERPEVLGYHLHFVNVYGHGKTMGVMMVRLFRNLPGVRYQNVIHEQVTPSLQRLGAPLGLVLTAGDVEVEHHGYTAEVMDQRGKNERNERLFRKQLAQTPDDIYSHYKYGDFLRRVPGRNVDARRLLDRCLELILAGAPTLPRELPYAAEVAALCALEAARVGDNGRAREVLDVALRRFVPTPNLHYLAASLALAEGRADTAILHYRRCLAYRGQVLVVPIQEGITGHVSLCGIAQACLQRGEFDRAERLLQQAVAIEPSYEVAHLALSRLCVQRGDNRRALAVLTDFLAVHPDSPGACQQTTLLLQRLGQTAAARRMGRHAVQLLEARCLEHEAAAMNKILAAM
jgi:tetratricopeptide (TPR) repeat protein